MFQHGVASGDPLADRIILWTRVTPATAKAAVVVTYLVATDPALTQIVLRGSAKTNPLRDYTVKVDAIGLRPDTTYYYRFAAEGSASAVGRTKTLPVGPTTSLRMAVVSCSNHAYGYFNAYGRIAQRADLDLVMHLGDYLYEYGNGQYGTARATEPLTEIVTLADYRQRHAQYKRDADSQAMHRQHPLVAIWDDHESANNSYRQKRAEPPAGHRGELGRAGRDGAAGLLRMDAGAAGRHHQPAQEQPPLRLRRSGRSDHARGTPERPFRATADVHAPDALRRRLRSIRPRLRRPDAHDAGQRRGGVAVRPAAHDDSALEDARPRRHVRAVEGRGRRRRSRRRVLSEQRSVGWLRASPQPHLRGAQGRCRQPAGGQRGGAHRRHPQLVGRRPDAGPEQLRRHHRRLRPSHRRGLARGRVRGHVRQLAGRRQRHERLDRRSAARRQPAFQVRRAHQARLPADGREPAAGRRRVVAPRHGAEPQQRRDVRGCLRGAARQQPSGGLGADAFAREPPTLAP